MDSKKKIVDIYYPFELIDNRNEFPQQHVIPCSVIVDDEETGGLFIVCPSEDIEYFGIAASYQEPALKFRMLNFTKRAYAIEIWMVFYEESVKFLKMHLNPHDKNVKKLLELGSSTGEISFHFYNTESELISSGVTTLDEEQKDWFDRNYELSSHLLFGRKGYARIADHLSGEISSEDRLYDYFHQSNPDFFVKEGRNLLVF